MATYSRNEIDPIPVVRISTGFDELDWIYGISQNVWGMPLRKISLWSGESGTGKSRTAVSICNKMASMGKRILYFQGEEHDLGGFVHNIKYDSFRLSDSRWLKDMMQDIRQDKPELVVVDSVNVIKDFKSGTASIIEGIIDNFREICSEMSPHILLLGQLNQNGTIKGSSTLPHLVDISLDMKKDEENDGLFSISAGMKIRGSRSGKSYKTAWEHQDHGVECISETRKLDSRWKKSHKSIDFSSSPKGVFSSIFGKMLHGTRI